MHTYIHTVGDCPQKRWEGRVCKEMHERTIHNVLTEGQAIQNGGSNTLNPPPGISHPAFTA